jgi:hypothetical protein
MRPAGRRSAALVRELQYDAKTTPGALTRSDTDAGYFAWLMLIS